MHRKKLDNHPILTELGLRSEQTRESIGVSRKNLRTYLLVFVVTKARFLVDRVFHPTHPARNCRLEAVPFAIGRRILTRCETK